MVAMKGLVTIMDSVMVIGMKDQNLRHAGALRNDAGHTTTSNYSNEFFVFRGNKLWRKSSF